MRPKARVHTCIFSFLSFFLFLKWIFSCLKFIYRASLSWACTRIQVHIIRSLSNHTTRFKRSDAVKGVSGVAKYSVTKGVHRAVNVYINCVNPVYIWYYNIRLSTARGDNFFFCLHFEYLSLVANMLPVAVNNDWIRTSWIRSCFLFSRNDEKIELHMTKKRKKTEQRNIYIQKKRYENCLHFILT